MCGQSLLAPVPRAPLEQPQLDGTALAVLFPATDALCAFDKRESPASLLACDGLVLAFAVGILAVGDEGVIAE